MALSFLGNADKIESYFVTDSSACTQIEPDCRNDSKDRILQTKMSDHLAYWTGWAKVIVRFML